MGKTDDKTEDYFDNIYRFADMWNGYIYHGKEVIKPEELVTADRIVGSWHKSKKYKAVSDSVKLWKGKYLRMLVLENQSYIDYRMVLRNMMQESITYNKQWKTLKNTHMEMKDLKGDEFLSGMSKTDKFIPVITLVINLSDKKWDAATSLYDILDLNDDDEIRNYINDYKINLYDYHNYEYFEEFTTSLKNLFEFIRFKSEKDKICERLNADDRYKALDSETVELINDISRIKVEVVGGYGNMCKAFEDYKLEGKLEGEEIARIDIVKKKCAKGKTIEEIADALELPVSNIKKYYDTICSNPTLSADEIYKNYLFLS